LKKNCCNNLKYKKKLKNKLKSKKRFAAYIGRDASGLKKIGKM